MPEKHCFFDKSRPCTSECTAYDKPPEDKEYVDKPWAVCVVALNLHRAGKHLGTLASGFGRIINHFTDQARTNQQPPARPT